MKFEFEALPVFEKELKRLAKKHKSLKKDIALLEKEIEENPNIGVNLGGGLRKIRIAITSKGTGKSGGARIVTQNIIINKSHKKITYIFLWDKSEIENVDIKILKQYL